MPILTTSLITGLAGVLSLAGVSPIASVNAPVSVVACDFTGGQLPPSATGIPEMPSSYVGNLRISFVNQAPVTATSVRFAVRYAGRTQIIDDAGTFSTGVPITQEFTPAAITPYETSSAQCAVESVSFSDGSTWQPS